MSEIACEAAGLLPNYPQGVTAVTGICSFDGNTCNHTFAVDTGCGTIALNQWGAVVVDSDGFRPNVGIMLTNSCGELLWARRVGGMDAWQFPQGGIRHGESPEQALFRELNEEIGLSPEQVRILGCTRNWLRYHLPPRLIRRNQDPLCIGQKQKWFLLQMLADDHCIQFDNSSEPPEFDHWRWVSYWYPLSRVVAFKREVYRSALKELAPCQQALVARGETRASQLFIS